MLTDVNFKTSQPYAAVSLRSRHTQPAQPWRGVLFHSALGVSDPARFEARLRDKDDTLRSFYDSATVMMGTVEIKGDDILHVSDNQATATFFATTPQAMQGKTARELGVSELLIRMWLKAYRASVDSGKPVRFDYEHEGKGWLKVTVNYVGRHSGGERFSYVVDDITDRKWAERALQDANERLEQRVKERTAELETLNRQLRHDAFHDALTGLPNRTFFTGHLGNALERARRQPETPFTVLFLDLDRFKVINDSLGHEVGDKLLVDVGRRLAACLREVDTVARLGGDEFTVLLQAYDLERAREVVARLQASLAQPFKHEGRELYISASIGVVCSDPTYERPEEVLRDADIAMYRAKEHHAGYYQVFDQAMREGAVRRLTLETELRGALERQELVVYYQPIVSLTDRSLRGFEALLRWQHPSRGLLPPVEFLAVAEETALIIQLDRYVLERSCRQLGRWLAARADLFLNVNLSSRQFMRPDLVPYVRHTLKQLGLDSARLNLEITENLLMNRLEPVDTTITQLKALGVGLHIDDFGKGYSSLAYLQRFPADVLKIDRSFTRQLTRSVQGGELVRTILMMARALGMKVVAEGIEGEEELGQLRALGCAFGQGYLFAEPLSTEQATAFIGVSGPSAAG